MEKIEKLIDYFCNFEMIIIIMTGADIKLKLFRQIDALQKNRLEEVYGLLKNYLRSQKDIKDWEELSEENKQGIFDAIKEIDHNKGVIHNKVIAAARKKYA